MSKFNLKNWFKKPVKITEEATRVIFTLNNEKINISILINPNDVDVGTNFGKLLYNTDSGKLKKSIATMLLDLSIKEPLYRPIIEETLECLMNLLSAESKQDSSPYIKPSQVFAQK